MSKDNQNGYLDSEETREIPRSEQSEQPWDNKFGEEGPNKSRQFSRSARNQPAQEATTLSKVLLLIIVLTVIIPFALFIIVNGQRGNNTIATRPGEEVRYDPNSTSEETSAESTSSEITLETREVSRETIEQTEAPIQTTVATTQAPPPPPQTETTPQPSGTYYTVQAGDSWFAIARNYGIDVYELAAANGVSIDSPIYPGDSIIIP